VVHPRNTDPYDGFLFVANLDAGEGELELVETPEMNWLALRNAQRAAVEMSRRVEQRAENLDDDPVVATGSGGDGEACTINTNCKQGLLCCPRNKGGVCQGKCLNSSGLCEGQAEQCPSGSECCDLSKVNRADICMRECPDDKVLCLTNAECPRARVCCQGLDGLGRCSELCMNGGVCRSNKECRGDQVCCNTWVTEAASWVLDKEETAISKVCLDQCNF
jgi:hypothetical protein